MHRAPIFILTLAVVIALCGCGPDEPAKPAPRRAPAATQDSGAPGPEALDYTYVGTVNSNIYHYPGCRWAKRIASHNLVGWETREQAVAEGRRKCKVCRP